MAAPRCLICLDDGVDEDMPMLCGMDDGIICDGCREKHIQHLMSSTLPGFAVRLACPIHPTRILRGGLRPFLGNSTAEARGLAIGIESRAASSLELACATCHKVRMATFEIKYLLYLTTMLIF
jgi:hypothetical protein